LRFSCFCHFESFSISTFFENQNTFVSVCCWQNWAELGQLQIEPQLLFLGNVFLSTFTTNTRTYSSPNECEQKQSDDERNFYTFTCTNSFKRRVVVALTYICFPTRYFLHHSTSTQQQAAVLLNQHRSPSALLSSDDLLRLFVYSVLFVCLQLFISCGLFLTRESHFCLFSRVSSPVPRRKSLCCSLQRWPHFSATKERSNKMNAFELFSVNVRVLHAILNI